MNLLEPPDRDVEDAGARRCPLPGAEGGEDRLADLLLILCFLADGLSNLPFEPRVRFGKVAPRKPGAQVQRRRQRLAVRALVFGLSERWLIRRKSVGKGLNRVAHPYGRCAI